MTRVDPDPFLAYVQRWLPPRSQVLEVGAGTGRLAAQLTVSGHAVTAIDPHAPDGADVRAIAVEDIQETDAFDAVVAQCSLHHVADLDRAFTAMDSAVRPGGVMVVQEFCWDLLDEPTARWFHQEMRRMGQETEAHPTTFAERWRSQHADLATYAQVRSRLDRHLRELDFVWIPYLAAEYLDADPEAVHAEETLIEAGTIRPVAFHYAGERPP